MKGSIIDFLLMLKSRIRFFRETLTSSTFWIVDGFRNDGSITKTGEKRGSAEWHSLHFGCIHYLPMRSDYVAADLHVERKTTTSVSRVSFLHATNKRVSPRESYPVRNTTLCVCSCAFRVLFRCLVFSVFLFFRSRKTNAGKKNSEERSRSARGKK